MRLLTVLSGAAIIMAGLFCLLNREQSFANYAFLLSIALICSASLGILSYFIAFRRRGLPLWSLIDGLLALALAYLILKGRIMTEEYLPQMIGFWVIFTGVMRLAGAIDIRKETFAFRVIVSALGIGNVLIGVYCFYYPLYTKLMMAELIGNIFILQGINIAAIGFGVKGKSAVYIAGTKPGSKDGKERRDWYIKDEMKETNQYSSGYKEVWTKLTESIVKMARVLRKFVFRFMKLVGISTRKRQNGKPKDHDIFKENKRTRWHGVTSGAAREAVRTRTTDITKTARSNLVNAHNSFSSSKEKERRSAIAALKPAAADNRQSKEIVEETDKTVLKRADTNRKPADNRQSKEIAEKPDKTVVKRVDTNREFVDNSQFKEKVEKTDKAAVKEDTNRELVENDQFKEKVEKTDKAAVKREDTNREPVDNSQFKGKVEKTDKTVAKKEDSNRKSDGIKQSNKKDVKIDKTVVNKADTANVARKVSHSKDARNSKRKRKRSGKTAAKQADYSNNPGKNRPLH